MKHDKHLLPGGLLVRPTADPLRCPPDEKAERETANCVRQLGLIEHYVHEWGVQEIRESHVLELHKLAVEDIYGCGGRYRTTSRTAELEGGGVVHEIPEPSLVPGLVREALDRINDKKIPALSRAAYALWRFNWIHPFSGGNGRTARAVSYFVVCIDFGRVPPGKPSFPTRISDAREQYVAALRVADAADREGSEDLQPMIQLVEGAMVPQLDAAIADSPST